MQIIAVLIAIVLVVALLLGAVYIFNEMQYAQAEKDRQQANLVVAETGLVNAQTHQQVQAAADRRAELEVFTVALHSFLSSNTGWLMMFLIGNMTGALWLLLILHWKGIIDLRGVEQGE